MTGTGPDVPYTEAVSDMTNEAAVAAEPSAQADEVRPRASSYRPDIDGLRAIAIVTVVVFHAFPSLLPGGFIGVDVFFVISGFLITGLLAGELARSGTVSLSNFYARRIRRLLPLSAIVLLCVLAASALLLSPLAVPGISTNVIAAALYVSNIAFAAQATNYMDAQVETSPVLHYWSLSVEEQFYVVWPLLIIVLAAIARRRGWHVSHTRRWLGAGLATIGLSSFALSLALTTSSPTWAFFSLPTRAWELAAGGGLALVASHLPRLSRPIAAVGGWLGLALLVGACLLLTPEIPYPGTAAIVPVAGTLLVIAAGGRIGTSGPGRLLGTRGMVSIGLLSYSWYLWHWPVLVFTRAWWADRNPVDLLEEGDAELGAPAPAALILGAVALSLLLAWLTHTLVEDPVRHSERLRRNVRASLLVGLALTLIPAGAALALRSADTEPATPAVRVAGVSMTPAQAVADTPEVGDCQVGIPGTEQPAPCLFGDPNGTRTMVLIGDSHATTWFPGLNEQATKRGWKLYLYAKGSCPVADVSVFNGRLKRAYTECDQWRDAVVKRLGEIGPINALVIGRSANHRKNLLDAAGAPVPPEEVSAVWAAGVATFLGRLPVTPARVVVLRDSPWATWNVPSCLSQHTTDPTSCDLDPAVSAGLDADLAAGEKTIPAITYVDVNDRICTKDVCAVMTPDGTIKFRDSHHFTATYARELGPVVWSRMKLPAKPAPATTS